MSYSRRGKRKASLRRAFPDKASRERAIEGTRERLAILLELMNERDYTPITLDEIKEESARKLRVLRDCSAQGMSRKDAAREAGLTHNSAKLMIWKRLGSMKWPIEERLD